MFIPFWKLYGSHEKGFVLFEIYFSKHIFMADYNFWMVKIIILNNALQFKLPWKFKKAFKFTCVSGL